MSTANKVVEALWSEFSAFIEKGIPVYFTFTNDLVEEILVREDIPFHTGRELINSEVRELVDIIGDHVYLKHDALVEIVDGFTAAILFVCQQVLAVEEMISTEDHSENAYFPHLREYISNQLEPLSQNPFEYNEFEKIWRTLSKEIFKISHNPKCVTFSFEQASGTNKARRFPLSQALYSKEDVIRLIDKVGYTNIRSNDEDYVYRCITSNKSILSRRGRRITSYIWMKDALVRQVKSLTESIGDVNIIKEVLAKKRTDIEQLRVKIYVDNIDWFSSEYVINLFDKANNLISDITIINHFFNTKIFGENYKVFVPSTDGDCWIISDDEYIPLANDELMVAYAIDNKVAIKGWIIDYFNIQVEEIKEDIISRSKEVLVFRFRINPNNINDISIKSGAICIRDQVKKKKEVTFKGGICVNINQDRFSCHYLPTHFMYKDQEYSLSGVVKINEAYHDFDEFRLEVKDILQDQEYTIEVGELMSFKLKVASDNNKIKKRVVYQYYKKQVLPICTVITKDKSSETLFEKIRSYQLKRDLEGYKSDSKLVDIKRVLDNYQLKGR